ncbi:kinase-like protein [Eremomyces bilateralis CBS 781.70]|uniref:Kinase-like protein n=1 Tax=Eremomyces bilateralis CBS 781.70 TaxID=1392243 RepID=A0A6G1G8M3_9PEZI|nr:kinase-like protein [Eremomyces bilateralis CBS 781.70]KAF1814271.1 kinase-like protein [Eremomyces bilateralis CBS 781.70]
MFSNALKSFTSNISSNYSVASQPSSLSGPWKIYDAKKKSTGKAASVFVFDKKSLEPHGGGLGGRSSTASLKRVHEEVVERLKKEASSLARLRHPSVLELVEPVEETRGGGLMFATELVTASLAGLLQEKDDQERSGGVGGRPSKYVVEDAEGVKRRRELEIDELEIQKGLLQLGKGLEFLHESAGLVHGNLTPDAIFINAKSDWKIAGLGFSSPPSDSTSSTPSISLSEVLNSDPRLPRFVQLNLDYSSPDFVVDNNITTAADMFTLGILILALYNSPHKSPLDTSSSISTYKRIFSSSSSVPSQGNNFLIKGSLPREVPNLLSRLITRRPAQRLSAREFQQASYFDNILISTIRFLESLPAKTPSEKSQFMRGLPRILNQFPKTVLEKKVLPALLDETKDRELLAMVLQNGFKIITTLPPTHARRAFTDKVIPKLKDVFTTPSGSKVAAPERDTAKEAGLMVLLENLKTVSDHCTGKDFKDDILPIVVLALESPTHSLVDAALRSLSIILSILDFSTVKNELFPVIAAVFSKTSSMGIKIRGLQAFNVLCGGTPGADDQDDGGLSGFGTDQSPTAKTNSVILDKYTIQEKVVPLMKGIKTKEPAVMMATLEVFREVGKIADSDFLAMEVLPILWSFSLGPLLNLLQFQSFMSLIKSISTRIEQEQTRKLQELGSTTAAAATSSDFMTFGPSGTNGALGSAGGDEVDFESLVLGRKPGAAADPLGNDWMSSASASSSLPHRPTQNTAPAPTFSWSSPQTSLSPSGTGVLTPQTASSRAITPELNLSSFATLQPSNPGTGGSFGQPLQHSKPTMNQLNPSQSSIDWSRASGAPNTAMGGTTNIWATPSSPAPPFNSMQSSSAFSIPPPAPSQYSSFNIAPPSSQSRPSVNQGTLGGGTSSFQRQTSQLPGPPAPQNHAQKQGLDKYESLI